MKKLFSLMLAVAMVFALAACGETEVEDPTDVLGTDAVEVETVAAE